MTNPDARSDAGAADAPAALAGISVLEIGGGAAGAYCGRLLADAGANVVSVALSDAARQHGIIRSDAPADRAFGDWLAAGKRIAPCGDAEAIAAMAREYDLIVVGESAGIDPESLHPRRASVTLDWIGGNGPYRDWRANDLLVQALTGLPQMAGPIEGPPLQAGDRHATTVAGVTACIAALAGLIAAPMAYARRFRISILEANLVLSEMHMHFFERDRLPMQRYGINRFHPNSPVGVYPCREGWVGITATTPEQWKSLCVALGMAREGADIRLATRELRFARLDEVEQAMINALATRNADEWAALGRRHKVPIVVVPDAAGILTHPIFAARESLAGFDANGAHLRVPRTPFALTRTPMRSRLDAQVAPAVSDRARADDPPTGSSQGASVSPQPAPPLAGISVVDFAMGWAGPLASRLMADLGADVIKIEAGRYPDWWRGVNWTPEYIAQQMYEDAKGFCALNRGKRGISLDLTTEAGRGLALSLVAGADAVVENQAAGVMDKLGLGYAQLSAANPGLVMLSMSAFGTGNPWSDTRAYGSTLEQGAGLPNFMGAPGMPPTMYQLAYGDPVGGLFGCAAALTALVHRRRGGTGQYVNLSMVEAMLQFATQPLLRHQVQACAPSRRGNRHESIAPHGFFPAAGKDQWIAIATEDGAAFARLAAIIGRPEWASDPGLAGVQGRKEREDEIDAAIAAWSCSRPRDSSAAMLQEAGITSAPLLHVEEIFSDRHLIASGFFMDLERRLSGPQRQAGLSIVQNGHRLGARRAAPLLGEHSREVLESRAGIDAAAFEALVRDAVITFEPRALRAMMVQPGS